MRLPTTRGLGCSLRSSRIERRAPTGQPNSSALSSSLSGTCALLSLHSTHRAKLFDGRACCARSRVGTRRAWSVWLCRIIVRFCAPTAWRRALLLIGGLCAVIDLWCVSGLSVKVLYCTVRRGTTTALHCTPKVGHGAHKPRTVLSRATARRKRAAAQDTSSTADRRDRQYDSRDGRHPACAMRQRKRGASAHGSRGSSRGYYAARPSDSRSARQPGAPSTARGCRHRRCRRRPPPRRAGLCGGAVSCGRARARALRPRTAIPAPAAGAPSAPSKPPRRTPPWPCGPSRAAVPASERRS